MQVYEKAQFFQDFIFYQYFYDWDDSEKYAHERIIYEKME
jgi:hypothetical protein